jgi:ABC-type transporter Mla MlaB component
MLRISTHEDDHMVRLQIEGTLAGCWVKELELAWRSAQPTLRGQPLQVDLTGTTRVDAAGYYLLKLMHKEGVQFLASGPSMRALISEITGI